MLVRPHDAPLSDEEWRAFLRDHDFGQAIAPGGPARAWPVVTPTHYALEGEATVVAHFARANPLWDALAERPQAVFSVIGAYVYVPTSWNAGEEAPPEWGVPTSYYAAVQLACDCEVVDDPDELAAILRALLARLQPEGGHERVEAGDNPYGRQLGVRGGEGQAARPGAIRGLRMTIRDVRAKFKFGGNRPPAHRRRVAERLAERGGPLDAEAAGHLARRTQDP